MGSLHSQIYQFGKLFQSCKAALEDRVNELHRNLKELMGPMLSDSSHCFVPLELYFTRKISSPPEFVFPSSPPSVYPVIYILPDESVTTACPMSLEDVPNCLVHCLVPDELYFTRKIS
jgi:hypothetical protein